VFYPSQCIFELQIPIYSITPTALRGGAPFLFAPVSAQKGMCPSLLILLCASVPRTSLRVGVRFFFFLFPGPRPEIAGVTKKKNAVGGSLSSLKPWRECFPAFFLYSAVVQATASLLRRSQRKREYPPSSPPHSSLRLCASSEGFGAGVRFFILLPLKTTLPGRSRNPRAGETYSAPSRPY
jgi:hypothetical protein